MTREQMEFLISQHLDGMLSGEDEVGVRELLAVSEEARGILEQYKKLDAALKAERLPQVKWDVLAEKISACVAKEGVIGDAVVEQPTGVPEDLEFAISQYVDETLSPNDRAAIQEVLDGNPEARRVLNEHLALNKLIRAAMPVPAMKWDVVKEAISEAVGSEAGALSEQDEFAISEYLDGALSLEEQSALERRMESEPALRQAMEQYKSLDRIVKQAMPTPAVKWDVLAERLSEAVDADAQRKRMFIGNWMARPMRLAVAALLIIGLGVAIVIALTRGTAPAPRVADVTVNAPEKAEGAAVAVVEFDMSPSLAQSGTDWYSAGDVVAMPTRLDVAISKPALGDPSPF